MWCGWSRTCPEKYDERDQRRTWCGFNGNGVTGGTIIQLARDHGYIGKPNGRASRPEANGHTAHTNGATNHVDAKPPTPWHKIEAKLITQGYHIKAVYLYIDASGVLTSEKVRFEHPNPQQNQDRKTFRWRHKVDSGELVLGKRPGAAIPPYGLPRLLEHADQPVFVVEGEKDADRLNNLCLVAISVEAGHEAAAAQHLASRVVFIVPDNDVAGRKRADAVLKAIEGRAASARIVELPNLPDKGDVSDWLDAEGSVDELIRLTEDLAHADANGDLNNFFTLFGTIELELHDEYLIYEVLPNEGIGYLFGASYTGKTFLVIDMSLSIARGVLFAGLYEAQCGAVVYIALEAPAGIRKRIVAYKREHRVKSAYFALLKYPLDICDPESVAGLIELLKKFELQIGVRLRLVVIDTLSKAMPGRDENSSKEMSLATRHMQLIQEATGGCVMAIHHTGKDEARGMRGSSLLAAGADFILQVKGSKDDPVRELWVEKLKDGEAKLVASYCLEQRHLGETAKGKPITSAVIEYTTEARVKTRKPLTAEQRVIMAELDDLIIAGRCQTARYQEHIPENARVVKHDDLMSAYYRRRGNDQTSELTKAEKDTFRKQINRMADHGYVGQWDKKIWKIKRK
jgi:hypothetical protein